MKISQEQRPAELRIRAIDLGAGTDESFIIGGDFSQLYAGVRLKLNIMPLTERYADTGQVGWLFFYRMDTTLMRSAKSKAQSSTH